MFVAIGVFNFIGYPTFAFMFGKAGEELTSRLRYRSFKVSFEKFLIVELSMKKIFFLEISPT